MPVGISAYVPLANVTLGSSAANVTFSSISQSYKDLVLVGNASTTGTAFSGLRVNGDTGTNYNAVQMYYFGMQTQNGQARLSLAPAAYFDSAEPWNFVLNLMDYTATNKEKCGLLRADNTSSFGPSAVAFRWLNTSAVTSLTLFGNNQPWAAGSSFALYGVSA